jgi:hypothetical protein
MATVQGQPFNVLARASIDLMTLFMPQNWPKSLLWPGNFDAAVKRLDPIVDHPFATNQSSRQLLSFN